MTVYALWVLTWGWDRRNLGSHGRAGAYVFPIRGVVGVGRRVGSRLAPDPDWMRPYEVAVLIGCAGNTVRRWADEGFLPSTRTEAGQRRYPRREIEAMAQAGELPQPWRAGGWDDHPEGPVTRQPPRFRRWEQADLLDEITGP